KNTACTFYILTVNIRPSFTGAQSSVQAKHEKLIKNILKQSEADLQGLLRRIEKLFPNSKHKFVTEAEYGYFVDTIKRMVAKHKIGLIVMGTKGASGLKKIIVGSNTSAVISKVKCALLAIPENAIYENPKEIAFATDFKVAYNHKMLETLKEVITLNKVSLRILNVLRKGKKLNDKQNSNKALLTDYLKDIGYSFYTLSKAEVDEALQCFVESRNIDMIAMVEKDRSLLQKILIRPTVKNISYHIDVPFLVLRE
ncbi:MAG: universal stress protein, partial [Saprospiraceae bacterium]|nr:universal stress protein [Saprospiraceae bacterium]